MGKAIDTVLAFSTQAGAAGFPTPLAATAGDNLTVRNFPDSAKAAMQAFICSSNAAGQKFRLSSPILHDNVTGLTFASGENPAAFLLGRRIEVALTPQDTLVVNGSCGAATTITAGLVNYYENVRGADADLRRWADIKGEIQYIKSVEVDLNAVAVGAWTDTVITATENQLHADYEYAVLGYECPTGVDIVGVKGEFTNNLRVCGPGVTSTLDITEYFIQMGELGEQPYIPVFNANDRNSVYVSAANHAAIGGGAASVYLILAQLRNRSR
jgi:hypothetical protein